MGGRGVIFRAAFAMGPVWHFLPRQPLSRFAEAGPVPFIGDVSAYSTKFAVGARVVRLRGVSRTDEGEAVRMKADRLAHLEGATV